MRVRVTEHKYSVNFGINYTWPGEVSGLSYLNPIVGVKKDGYSNRMYFKLRSGEMTSNWGGDKNFKELNWSQIHSIQLKYD